MKNPKIMILIAPSEWKNFWWEFSNEELSFNFEKPTSIANSVTENDLKCKWQRFDEWVMLNERIENWPFLEAINRYSWVAFNNIWYSEMSDSWKKFLEDNLFILSWMYWIIKPLDKIWNYKLPIETKWLYKFWWEKIAEKINEVNPDIVINLLPNSYSKMIWISNSKSLFLGNTKIININFFEEKYGDLEWEVNLKKITHWVKKIRWEFIREICEKNLTDYKEFWWEIIENNIKNSKNIEFVNIIFVK